MLGLSPVVDSPATAQILPNSVRAWDRSGIQTIRPPAPGTRRVLNRARPTTPARSAVTPAAVTAFWSALSPSRLAASPARWDAALTATRTQQGSTGTRTADATLARIARDFAPQIDAAARRHDVSAAMILAMIAVESAGRPAARSPKGAQGLMQLIPATARRFGVRDVWDPAQNVTGGAAYLSWLLARFGEDPVLALAGYNAGEGAVDRHKGVPPYAETRAYVVKVFDALLAARALCATAPGGPRQVCTLTRTGS
jgi:soluble lytic murein transglycosylase-like protein